MKYIVYKKVILVTFISLAIIQIQAQYNCGLKPPVVKIDFGEGDIQDMNSYLSSYVRDFSTCPNDGFYSYTSNSSNCFNGDWFTLNHDHSANNQNGNMMLVNASVTGGVFFNTRMNGFKGNATYQLNFWMMNVCKINGGCAPLPPNISINIITPEGKKIGIYQTGLLTQSDAPRWRVFTGYFKTPAEVTSLNLTMADNTLGGCGNDFAMDDITISECVIPKTEVSEKPASVAQKTVKQQSAAKQTPVAKAPVIKQNTPTIKQVKKDTTVIVTKPIIDNKPIVTNPATVNKPLMVLPEPIKSRANPVIKQIETDAGDVLIQLYDNGEIDGDTVTVYHNNQLIVSRAGLSENPVSFHVEVNKMQPHHELVMVANNLGSIPPNTSMMIVTANHKRYEVFISSSEQKNAKVVIDLKE